MDAIGFRAAIPQDAEALGALHVACWRETYAGLLPAAILADLSAAARAAMWRAMLEDPAAHGGASLVVAESGGVLVGFGACGAQRDAAFEARGFGGDIGAVYVLRAHQRAGTGARIMALLAKALLGRGLRGASLWVLRENEPARAFYAHLGGTVIGEKTGEQAGGIRTELAYGWRDLTPLTR